MFSRNLFCLISGRCAEIDLLPLLAVAGKQIQAVSCDHRRFFPFFCAKKDASIKSSNPILPVPIIPNPSIDPAHDFKLPIARLSARAGLHEVADVLHGLPLAALGPWLLRSKERLRVRPAQDERLPGMTAFVQAAVAANPPTGPGGAGKIELHPRGGGLFIGRISDPGFCEGINHGIRNARTCAVVALKLIRRMGLFACFRRRVLVQRLAALLAIAR